MRQLKLLLLSSLLLFSGCATVDVPNFRAFVTLPASGDGFGVYTVSKQEVSIPAGQWEEVRKKGIVILPEDWKILKKTIRKNCITNKCHEAVGYMDGLFLAIDHALQKVN